MILREVVVVEAGVHLVVGIAFHLLHVLDVLRRGLFEVSQVYDGLNLWVVRNELPPHKHLPEHVAIAVVRNYHVATPSNACRKHGKQTGFAHDLFLPLR